MRRLRRERICCKFRLVEHPCYRCQASIEEGTAFCPHCGAPQIRVVLPEAASESINIDPSSPDQQVVPASGWNQSSAPYAVQPAAGVIQWELAWKGALLAGAAAAVLTAIPIVAIGCCLWMLGAGAMSVALYQRQVPGTYITPGMGMKLGALAGTFGFIINACVTIASFLLFRGSPDFRNAMQEQMQKSMARNPDPKVQQMMQQMMEFISSPQGLATLMVVTLLVLAVMFLLFTGAGGALGASMFGRRRELR